MKRFRKIFPAISRILIPLLLFTGGLGLNMAWISWIGVFIPALLLMAGHLLGKRILFPKTFVYYLLFLFLFALSLYWTRNFFVSFSYLLMFAAGGLFWLIFYNSENLGLYNKVGFEKPVIFLGIVFFVIFLTLRISGDDNIGSFGLIRFSNLQFNHSHLGDIWSVVMLIILNRLVGGKTFKKDDVVLAILGIIVLLISLSRSAYISFILGVLLMRKEFANIDLQKGSTVFNRKWGKVLVFFVIIVAAMFFLADTQKTLLFARTYYIQGVIGFIKYPFGVGIGNFSVISNDTYVRTLGLTEFSNVSHNIFLEVLTGMGILGFSFIIWFAGVAREFLKKTSSGVNLLPKVIFLALTVNFIFDYTYFIPTMLWLWFISLGLLMIGK